MQQNLIIQFDNGQQDLIYQGSSWLRKNLSDEVEIYYNKIVLSFSRSKSMGLQECLFSPKSVIRYEIQRALCFYLSVVGFIPKVEGIVLLKNGKEELLENISFSEKWHKCKVARTLDAGMASRMFDGRRFSKDIYISMSYYLKAQMDHFSHDCFRAAWSGLNVLYTAISPENASTERDKLNVLKKWVTDGKLSAAVEYVKNLEEDSFWGKLNWYMFVKQNCDSTGKKKKTKDFLNGVIDLQDAMLVKRITDLMRAALQIDLSEKENEIERAVSKNIVSYTNRTKFLIAAYCYMVRNRSFHAERAYPLFEIRFNSTEKTIEQILTELLLITVECLMKELSV